MPDAPSGLPAESLFHPIMQSIDLLKIGKTREIRQLLLLPAGFQDVVLADGLRNLHSAIDLMRAYRVSEASNYLASAEQLSQSIGLEDTKAALLALTFYCCGVNCLHRGSTSEATQLMERALQIADKLKFRFPDVQSIVLSGRITAYVAQVRAALNNGDSEAAERLSGRTQDILHEAHAWLKNQSIDDPASMCQIYGIPIELQIPFILQDLFFIRFDSAETRLSSVKDYIPALEPYRDALPIGPLRNTVSSMLLLFDSLEQLIRIARSLLIESKSWSPNTLGAMRTVLSSLFQAQQMAAQAGDQGTGLFRLSRSIEMYSNTLLSVSKPKEKEFVPISSAISGASFFVMSFLIYLFIDPPKSDWPLYFLSSAVLSLIFGFGYGALRFVPLLQSYRNTVTKVKADSNS